MQIEPGDIAKIAAAGAGLGAGIAAVRPFADRLFTWWLSRLDARATIADAKERAIERISVSYERTVGVLEAIDKRFDRVDARLDRMEAHLGIPVTPSAIPSPPPPAMPRRQLTDPALPRVEARPSSPSSPAGEPA